MFPVMENYMKKEVLLEIRNIIEDIKNNGISEMYFNEIYNLIGCKDIPMNFNNKIIDSAHFTPNYNVITVNLLKSNDWTKKIVSDSLDSFEISDLKLLESYLYVVLLAHEIEHSHQKLIADNKMKPNYEYKKQAFSDIYNVMIKKDYILPRPVSLVTDIIRFIIYNKNAYDFILERNATIESYVIASKIAKLSNESEILNYLLTYRNAFIISGYIDSTEGTLKYTYDKLEMINKYNKLIFPTDITLFEKAREGLELTREERTKLFKLLKKRNDLY